MSMQSLNHIAIREGQIKDAEDMLRIQKEVIEEKDFLLTDSAEFNKTADDQKHWIRCILQNEREKLLIAEVEGKMAGWLVFQSPNRLRLNHTGSFGMMVQKEYRNMHIGRKLLEALLIWAENHEEIEKVSLGVLSINERAIHLYRSLGFLEEGRKVDEVKIGNRYVDDILMYKRVKKG
ncbi:MAG: GNAT family N-acetyltransferase [Lysinibacillus sp.]